MYQLFGFIQTLLKLFSEVVDVLWFKHFCFHLVFLFNTEIVYFEIICANELELLNLEIYLWWQIYTSYEQSISISRQWKYGHATEVYEKMSINNQFHIVLIKF